MATSNLVSKTIGKTQVQSGNGIPDHVAPLNTLYYNEDNNLLWKNVSGVSNGWMMMPPAIYGELSLDTNVVTSTLPSSINVFLSLSGLTWVSNNNNMKGFTVVGNKLKLNNGLSGRYRIIANLGIDRNVTSNNYMMGVSINGVLPPLPVLQTPLSADGDKTSGHGYLSVDVNLNGGDTIELTVSSLLNTSVTFYVRNSSLIIYRIYS